MSDPTGGIKMPGFMGGISATFNLVRGSMDASQANKPMDQLMSFKSTALDIVGEAAQCLRPCSKFTKAMPFIGKAVSINDGRMAWNELQAEKSKPSPDPAKIIQHQRNLFVASADTISPILPMGTMVSTVFDIGSFMVRHPPTFSTSLSSTMEFHPFHRGWE
jgi:hypothetical protein